MPARIDHAALKARLVADRPAPSDETPRRDTDNWVGTWIDGGHRVTHHDGLTLAERAITDDGQLIWMVRAPGRRFAFHADRETADEAIAQAAQARRRRRRFVARRREIVALRRRVLTGRVRLTVLTTDAAAAGLCDLGIRGFLQRIGRGNKTAHPALLLAPLSWVDRQVGYAMLAAHDRVTAERRGRGSGANIEPGTPKAS